MLNNHINYEFIHNVCVCIYLHQYDVISIPSIDAPILTKQIYLTLILYIQKTHQMFN